MSFNSMSSVGFTNFLKFFSILNQNESAPTSTTISNSCLDLKRVLENVLIQFVQSCVFDTFTISLDIWTDNSSYKNPFINVNLHFIDQNWNFHQFLLSKCYLGRPHTAENIKTILETILERFQLMVKVWYWMVGDKAANLVAAANRMKVPKIDCILHGIHNLITSDLMKSSYMKSVLKSLLLIKKVQRHFWLSPQSTKDAFYEPTASGKNLNFFQRSRNFRYFFSFQDFPYLKFGFLKTCLAKKIACFFWKTIKTQFLMSF